MAASCSDDYIPPTEASIGIPAGTEGVILTVTNVEDYDQIRKSPGESRPITIYFRIENQNKHDIMVRPSDFQIIDNEGQREAITEIIYREQPSGERELASLSRLSGGLLYGSDKDLEDLTLQYAPNSETEPISIHLARDENARKLQFDAEDIYPLIIQENDFDSDIKGARDFSNDEIPWINKELEEPSVLTGQSLDYEDKIIGNVFVFGYVSPYSVSGFFYSTKHSYSQDIDGVGDVAVYEEKEENVGFDKWQIMFVRCHVVVKMNFSNEVTIEDLISYSGKLDERITPVVCD